MRSSPLLLSLGYHFLMFGGEGSFKRLTKLVPFPITSLVLACFYSLGAQQHLDDLNKYSIYYSESLPLLNYSHMSQVLGFCCFGEGRSEDLIAPEKRVTWM